MSEKSNKNLKGRNWVCVIYPESLPQNWEQIIILSGLKCALSPLHDKDLNADEEEKKAHYHLIFCWDNGSTTFNNAKLFTESLNGTIPQLLHNVRGYYRYFTHKDNPEKYQYNEKDIKLFNGFNIKDYCTPTSAEISQMKRDIKNYINEKEIIEYCDLLDSLDNDGLLELFDCASSNTLLFNTYLTSKRNKKFTMRTEIL